MRKEADFVNSGEAIVVYRARRGEGAANAGTKADGATDIKDHQQRSKEIWKKRLTNIVCHFSLESSNNPR